MKPTITGYKRPLEQDTSTDGNTNKRYRASEEALEIAAILSAIDDPHCRDLSPATQEGLRALNVTLQMGYPLLDLSQLSAAQISDLPIDLINPAIHSVQTLLLPPGLTHLPSFCKHLANLQRLELPDFAGSSLDLRGLRSLHQLRGSAGGIFEHMLVNTLTDIYFSAPNTASKIRVYRYDNDRLLQQHALPSHPYFKVLPGNQGPDLGSLNGETFFQGTRTLIYCDTIAPEILHRRLSPQAAEWKKTGYFGITDVQSLSRSIPESKNSVYVTALLKSDRFAFVDDASFGLWVKAQFSQMLAEMRNPSSASFNGRLLRGLRAISSNHELHCLLIVKSGPVPEFIVEIYDPNKTRTHKRMVANSLTQITDPAKPWRLSDFIEQRLMKSYMRGNSSAALCFVSQGQRSASQPARTDYWLAKSQKQHPDIMFTLLDMVLTTEIKPYWEEIVSLYQQKQVTLAELFRILECHGNHPTMIPESLPPNNIIHDNLIPIVREFSTCVEQFAEILSVASPAERSTLPAHALRGLLQPIDTWSLMIATIKNENKEGLNFYFALAQRLLLKNQIPAEDILVLLSAKNAQGDNALSAALKANDATSLQLLSKLITTLVDRGELKADDALAFTNPAMTTGASNPSSTTGAIADKA